jgi:alkylhydroperoxidase family enzyme
MINKLGDYEGSDLPVATKAALRATDAIVWDLSRLTDQVVTDLRVAYSEAEVVEIMFTAAMYAGLHRFVAAMRVPAPTAGS